MMHDWLDDAAQELMNELFNVELLPILPTVLLSISTLSSMLRLGWSAAFTEPANASATAMTANASILMQNSMILLIISVAQENTQRFWRLRKPSGDIITVPGKLPFSQINSGKSGSIA
jgi:hypothetical protein